MYNRILFLILGLGILALSSCKKPELPEIPKAKPPVVAPSPTPKTPQPVVHEEREEFVKKPNYLLSPEAYQLILDFEVGGGQAYYNKALKRPSYPGASSGVTIGIGYDLGYYTEAEIREDWHMLPSKTLERLVAVRGKTGSKAKALIPSLGDIEIPWAAAEEVFQKVSVPKFSRLTHRTYKDELLRENAQGTLVSLTFNRGTSMTGDRRREMRAIRDLVTDRAYNGMATQLELMKRIWRGTDVEKGLSRRRDAEAKLMRTP